MIAITLVGIYAMFPETRGHTLEEIARVFEGETAHVPNMDKVIDEVHHIVGHDERAGKVEIMAVTVEDISSKEVTV